MTLDRRRFVQVGVSAGGLGWIVGCDASPAWNFLARQFEEQPESVRVPSGREIDVATHVLNRLGFGPRPGDFDRVRTMGVDEYIEEQLSPETISDTACDLRTGRFETLETPAGDMFEYRRRVVENELFRHTLLRAVYSRRQLFESMVRFWTDHFNIAIGKSECAWLKTVDDREVIRAHALGNFRDLLRASALSPAMLVYLDGQANRKAKGGEKANENYARELMELHTLGVHGGYRQKDVMEAARCLTGWTVNRKWFRGRVEFHPSQHDDGPKRVLGVDIPAGEGKKDFDRLLDIVVEHPSTAQHLSRKLCRRFVADEPPPDLVDRVARAFRESDYEIKPTLRTLFHSETFRSARGTRLKRPFRYVVSALRALDVDTDGIRLYDWLQRMGQPPFNYPTPDGYPDEPAPWLGTLLWRWNFALELAGNRIPGTRVDWKRLSRWMDHSQDFSDPAAQFAAHLAGRRLNDGERAALKDVLKESSGGRRNELSTALVMASPVFQRY